jgi:hypothetical protein
MCHRAVCQYRRPQHRSTQPEAAIDRRPAPRLGLRGTHLSSRSSPRQILASQDGPSAMPGHKPAARTMRRSVFPPSRRARLWSAFSLADLGGHGAVQAPRARVGVGGDPGWAGRWGGGRFQDRACLYTLSVISPSRPSGHVTHTLGHALIRRGGRRPPVHDLAAAAKMDSASLTCRPCASGLPCNYLLSFFLRSVLALSPPFRSSCLLPFANRSPFPVPNVWNLIHFRKRRT